MEGKQRPKRAFVDCTIEVIANDDVVFSHRDLVGGDVEVELDNVVSEPWVTDASVRVDVNETLIAHNREEALNASDIEQSNDSDTQSNGGENE